MNLTMEPKSDLLSWMDGELEEPVVDKRWGMLRDRLVQLSYDDDQFGDKVYSPAELLGFMVHIERASVKGYPCPECGNVNPKYHCNCQKRGN